MLIFKNHIYNEKKITSVHSDNINGLYIWVAFNKNSNNVCELKKVSAHKVSQVYYDLEVPVDKINRITSNASSIFLAVESSTHFGYIYNKINPLSSSSSISVPVGVDEFPIDIATFGSNLYFLTPGTITGEVAKIVHMTVTGNIIEILELDRTGETIKNASGMTVDDNGDLWIVTNESPVRLIRVFAVTGGLDFQVNTIS